MEKVLVNIVLLLFFIYSYQRTRHGLHILQLENYYIDRFTVWMKRNKDRVFYPRMVLVLVIVPCFALFLKLNKIGLALMILVYIVLIIAFPKKKEKKPFVVTSRIKRIYATYLILFAIAVYFTNTRDYKIVLTILNLIALVVYHFIYIVSFINKQIDWGISRKFCKKAHNKLKEMPNFCPSFHLSLQSGSNKVLWEMNRHYTTKEYLNKVNLVRKYFENAAITTDLIVGYPTETQKDFENTLNFIKQVGFASVHYFAYSSRKGTKAGALPQINGTIIAEREESLKPVVEEMHMNYLQNFLGHPLDVLVEEQKGVFYEGVSENYIRCYIDSEVKLGEIVKVMPVSVYQKGLLCKVID